MTGPPSGPDAGPPDAGPVLELRGVTKRFPGVVALDDVSIRVAPHEVVGLIGENGAGKSTVLKILSGVYQPDEGVLLMHGEPVRFRGPRDAARAGIGIVHQEQSLVGSVSVAENLLLGVEGRSVRGGFYRWSELNARAERQLAKIGSKISPTARVNSLTFAQRQMIEVVKAISVEDHAHAEPVVVFDEPTSVLAGEDLETLFAQIERLRSRASVIFVSHRLDEVLRVSDRVYVLKDGRCVAEREPGSVDTQELYRLMVGRASTGQYYREEEQGGVDDAEEVLGADGLTLRGRFSDVSLSVRRGEVLGIAGVVGSGREDLCRAIFGAEPVDGGELRVGGKRVRFRVPADAVRAGVGYIPAERRFEGVAMGMSVAENILLADSSAASVGPFAVPRRRAALVKEWIDRLRIRTPDSGTDVASLSGGNQQKVVLAKWMSSPRLRVLVLDHPTRGLDVGAKEDVYRFVREMCAQGLAIVLLSDTLEETIALSHRVLVMRDGQVAARFDAAPGAKPTQVDLVEQMV
ncbi:MAG TPA: sugar ABC transporter ATP-binding protein [Pseudonocardia sp.]|uniref:sugar ABC transporter ATP-binding protein n=1 Tax=Pseudonocardia sp. TaxID=60912 RepID=UPI002CDD1F1F|nr:sugar ABC transporter ATP-binding protein [Pseudonocardia sp.]HTF53790.1 sugar ABC transporter ATP-binding protein [Pseudonocardia sp.]